MKKARRIMSVLAAVALSSAMAVQSVPLTVWAQSPTVDEAVSDLEKARTEKTEAEEAFQNAA